MASDSLLTEETTISARLLEPAGWRLSWGAVGAGVIVALVAHILLNLLGLGIGAVVAEPARTPDGETVQNVGIAAALWWAASGVIAAGLGGWFAGRAMGSGDRDDGHVHGILSWAATTLIVAFFLTSVLGGVLAGALGRLDLDEIRRIEQPQAPQPRASPAAPAAPDQKIADAAKQATPAERETAANAIASSALASFFALILGAIAAAAGGRWGVMSARKSLLDD